MMVPRIIFLRVPKGFEQMKSFAKSPRRGRDSRPSYNHKRNDQRNDRFPAGERVREERTEGFDNLIAGRNAVMETLKNGSRIDTVYIARGATGGSIGKIVAMAREGGYPVKEVSSEKAGDSIRILYGGSVKPSTIEEQMSQSDIDGALVGGASLKAESFNEIIANTMKVSV